MTPSRVSKAIFSPPPTVPHSQLQGTRLPVNDCVWPWSAFDFPARFPQGARTGEAGGAQIQGGERSAGTSRGDLLKIFSSDVTTKCVFSSIFSGSESVMIQTNLYRSVSPVYHRIGPCRGKRGEIGKERSV
ncbi:hypothetical protein GWI33_004601 [Rhynchophorus ferrugineus]|uniref:Uncharacterized protein n=1 Tax=Rhynchophorus ferrugineus TaxID=354439 RepID=A0A834MMW5_RHYFE|nr:hypothetical protein GWI33_004601 [Rhynchophorus ferrugineus]